MAKNSTTETAQLYTCTPKQCKQFICDCIEAGLTPLILGSPGVGKSEIVKQVADLYNLQLVDMRLSMMDATDLQGLPHFENGKAVFTPYNMFPLEGDPLPEGKQGTLIFLDELNSAPRSVLCAAYKLILDHMVGNYKLHRNCVIVAAGNRIEDRAIVNNIGTAMQSRLVSLTMEPSFKDWLTEVAIPRNYDERIVAYLNMYNEKLCTFDPESNEKAFACPRSWSFIHKLVTNKKKLDENAAKLFAGIIGAGTAVEFTQFCNVYNKLIKYENVVADPKNCPLPEDKASLWALIVSLANKVTKVNMDKLCTYANKFELPFRIVFYRYVTQKYPELANSQPYINAMVELAQYMV